MINDKIEILIIKNLFFNEVYTREVLPFVLPEYFSDESEKILVLKIKTFIETFGHLPTREAIIIQTTNDTQLSQTMEDKIKNILGNLNNDEKTDHAFLIESTEKFCKDRALYNAVYATVNILEDGKKATGEIPKLLSDALAVSFDPSVGHNYLDDADSRFDFYHKKEEKFPFDLKFFNLITKGGVPRKTLNVILAGTAVGKSLAMCHMAGSYLMSGQNVLYITLEMAQERIAERIDANLLNTPMQDLAKLPKDVYNKKIESVRSKTTGRFFIKEYPTATATVTNFRSLLNELALKKSFKPDIIFVDYLNIAASARLTANHTANSYTYVKSIAEEFRGLAVEYNVPLWTATQTNRAGFVSTDIGLENTSESFGLPATADFMVALWSTDELEELGQIVVKQLKNRYNDVTSYKKFVVGIDRSKMRLFDLDAEAQKGLQDAGTGQDDVSAFDKTQFGNGMKAEKTYARSKFSDINF
jgi:archaellum biogenesis ATPase FlaH